eukprot:3587352-Pyramimonas_sp.AAC.1
MRTSVASRRRRRSADRPQSEESRRQQAESAPEAETTAEEAERGGSEAERTSRRLFEGGKVASTPPRSGGFRAKRFVSMTESKLTQMYEDAEDIGQRLATASVGSMKGSGILQHQVMMMHPALVI